MGPAGTYALITFTTGVILLLGWLYANAANPRCGALLTKSLLLFALPIAVWPGSFFVFPLGMWLSIGGEEGLKAFASTRERNRHDKFWLVALFGIFELMLDKPFWSLALARNGESWDRVVLLGLVYATALPVPMHAVTAAIYAFAFERRPWAAFLVSWLIHIAFNESADAFGTSPIFVIAETVVLVVMLAALWNRLQEPQTESS